MLERCPPIVRSWAPGFTIRTVFGIDRLREKLVAHAAGIDDRVLEAFKLELLRGMGPYGLSSACRPRLRNVDEDHAWFRVPRPEVGNAGRLAIVKIARAEITRIARDPIEWKPLMESLSAGPYVDLGRIFVNAPSRYPDQKPTPSSGP